MLLYQGHVYRAADTTVTSVVTGPQGDGIMIEMFVLPVGSRGHGKGTAAYNMWEKSLDKSIQFIYVIPIERSRVFWKKLGFVPAYIEDDQDVSDLLYVKDRLGKPIVPVEFNPDQYDVVQGLV